MLIENRQEYNLLLREFLYNNAILLNQKYSNGSCNSEILNNLLINRFLSVLDSPRLELTDDEKEPYLSWLKNKFNLISTPKELFFFS